MRRLGIGIDMNIPGWDALDEAERALVAWQYRFCGDFKQALWEVIGRADDDNLELLRKGFPVEVGAFIRFSRERGYWRAVCEKAGGDVEAGY